MKICISAGELSGDEHAAGIVSAIKEVAPEATFSGMGGSKMRACGVQTAIDSERSASVMGFGDVAKSIFKIAATLSELKAHIASVTPDLLILVDYPDFNLRVAKFAAGLGIPIFYFIPPTIWAWRRNRVNAIKSYVTRVGLIYPFEREHFQESGYNQAYFVGHPFCDDVKYTAKVADAELWRKKHGFAPTGPIVAILPGSRRGEIRRHLAMCVECSRLLAKSHPELQFALGVADGLERSDFDAELGSETLIRVVQGDTLGLLRHAEVGMLKSGTSNLQAAFFGLPHVMFYKTSLLAEVIVKSLVGLQQYSPVNIIRANSVRELTQRQATPQNVAVEVARLLFDAEYREQVQLALSQVCLKLQYNEDLPIFAGANTAYRRAARLALDLCK